MRSILVLFRAPSIPSLVSKSVKPRSRHLYRLNGAGFDAYLVGGCDALLGKMPKDFDVATNATPEQVRDLFRNSRLIGRRFRIVHVRFGREVIEVTTFRGKPQDEHGDHIAHQSDDGLLLRDNVWGNIEEDALRRDFTVNALTTNIADFTIHDFANGVRDIESRTLRLIGDPATRYREDPVRMLRAVRFAAKLGFTIEPATEAPMYDLAPLLLQIPPARLFDEVLKLFMAGHGLITFRLLSHYNLFGMLFPESEEAMADAVWAEELIEQALANTDKRIAEDRPVTPAFLLAAFLWAPVVHRQAELEREGMPAVPALQTAAQQVVSRQLQHTSIPKRFGIPMREIWELQARLPMRRGKRVCLQNPRASSRALLMTSCCYVSRRLKFPVGWATGGRHFRKAMSTNSSAYCKKSAATLPAKVTAGAKNAASRGRRTVNNAIRSYIGLGSNLENPKGQVQQALQELAALPLSRLVASSSLYATSPVGPQDQPDFINAVACLETHLSPLALLDQLQALEQRHRRRQAPLGAAHAGFRPAALRRTHASSATLDRSPWADARPRFRVSPTGGSGHSASAPHHPTSAAA